MAVGVPVGVTLLLLCTSSTVQCCMYYYLYTGPPSHSTLISDISQNMHLAIYFESSVIFSVI